MTPGPAGLTPARNGHLPWLGAILLVGFGLRVWGLGFGLSNLQCRPDETTVVNVALGIAAGDPNPHFFNYPTLHLYLLAFLDGVWYLACRVFGLLSGRAALERLVLTDPSPLYLLARSLTAVLGTASVGLVYLIGRQLADRRAGLLAAGFLAAAFLHVRDSHFATVDVPATFHLLIAWSLLLRYLSGGRRTGLVGAAVFFGLAASTKYNLGLFVGAALAAPWITRSRSLRVARCSVDTALVLIVAVAAFLAGTPFALLDPAAFLRDLVFEQAHFSRGHAGLDLGPSWLRHLTFTLPYGLGWPLMIAALAGWGWVAWRRRPGGILLAGSMLVYFAVAGSGKGVFMRYLLPLIPLLCLCAGTMVSDLARNRRNWLVVATGIALALPSVTASGQYDRLLTMVDTRVEAARWIEARVPDGAIIALVGSDYGLPQLRRTREWLRQEYKDQRAAGLPARRLERQLSLDDYPRPPAFRVVEVKPAGPYPRTAVQSTYDLSCLRRAGVDWLVTQEHPLPYSQVDPGLVKQLQHEAVAECVLDPFVPGTAAPIYDQVDAFYVPVAGFSGVTRPGPRLRIYRLTDGAVPADPNLDLRAGNTELSPAAPRETRNDLQ